MVQADPSSLLAAAGSTAFQVHPGSFPKPSLHFPLYFVEVIVSVTLSCPAGEAEDCHAESEDILLRHALCSDRVLWVLVEGTWTNCEYVPHTHIRSAVLWGSQGPFFHFKITSFLCPLLPVQSLAFLSPRSVLPSFEALPGASCVLKETLCPRGQL